MKTLAWLLSAVIVLDATSCLTSPLTLVTRSPSLLFVMPPTTRPLVGEHKNLDGPRPMYQYRYFAKPKPVSTVCWPGIGDFIVFSIDPVASVAHLDKIARRAARKIPVHKFVALTTSVRTLACTSWCMLTKQFAGIWSPDENEAIHILSHCASSPGSAHPEQSTLGHGRHVLSYLPQYLSPEGSPSCAAVTSLSFAQLLL